MDEPSIQIKSILDRLSKPILYASRDGFSHISQIRGLRNFVNGQIEDALKGKLALPLSKRLNDFRTLFVDFESLSLDEREARLRKAQFELKEMDHLILCSTDSNPRISSFSWDRPVQYLKGVGPRRAELLGRLHIRTSEDLLYFLPWRYEDRSQVCKIRDLEPGIQRTLYGVIQSSRLIPTHRKRFTIVEIIIGDDSGSVVAKWFNQPYLQKMFNPGSWIMLSGKAKPGRYRRRGLEIENPVYEQIDDEDQGVYSPGLHTGRIVPIYHETNGISSRQIRLLIRQTLDASKGQIKERFPDSILKAFYFPGLEESLERAHFPHEDTDMEDLSRARTRFHQRLIFEELLLLQFGLGLRRNKMVSKDKGIKFRIHSNTHHQFLGRLPYQLTRAQLRVLQEIMRDMEEDRPMNRLLQGDVGSGKTIVAIAAMSIAVNNGYQAALMVPTEILAEQHYLTLKRIVEPLGITPGLVTQGLSKRIRHTVDRKVASGEINLVVGTHALTQEGSRFRRLGLAVIDEQHKFGVMQRASFSQKGVHPDVLVMTATPIPRTLALSVYGDLDVSIIDELPQGRGSIQTMLFSETQRHRVYRLIEDEIQRGRQAYVIYPLVEESEKLDLKAATQMAHHLEKNVFRNLNVGLLHGQMKSEIKEMIMKEFKEGKIHILVATTVVEVGLDIPNATVMLVEHADRYGLAQLHQLRGRIGRGPNNSYCLLMAGSSGSKGISEEARKRLSILVRHQDGFVIAEEDLALRGPGEFFGTRQTGLPDLLVANIVRDSSWLEKARTVAFGILGGDPFLKAGEHKGLREAVARKWKDRIDLSTVG